RAESRASTARELAGRIAGLPLGPRFLHISGRHQTHDIAAELSAAGHRADATILYDQIARPLSPNALEALQSGEIACAPLFSRRTAKLFLAEAKAHGLPRDLRIVCISAAVAEVVAHHFGRVIVSDNPTQEAMVLAL
ncbi:MAG: uroporphyrinogen-III synthase, partial [Pseudomonadota bacterium]